MSSRPLFQPQPVIVNGDMSQASLTSLVTIISNISMFSYSFSWSGSSPVGTIGIQVSNDYALNTAGTGVTNPGTWTTLTLNINGSPSSAISVSGNTGTAFADIDQCGAYAVRAVYTKGSGTGTLQSIFKGKVA